LRWVGASCHDEAELARACAIEADYVLLGPVRATASHPGQPGIGWQRFSEVAAPTAVPVYALGGLADRHGRPAGRPGAAGRAPGLCAGRPGRARRPAGAPRGRARRGAQERGLALRAAASPSSDEAASPRTSPAIR